MSIGLILIIILVIFLLGGFSGRFGGYGYGFGHGGMGVIGIILIILVVLLLMGRLWSVRTANVSGFRGVESGKSPTNSPSRLVDRARGRSVSALTARPGDPSCARPRRLIRVGKTYR